MANRRDIGQVVAARLSHSASTRLQFLNLLWMHSPSFVVPA